MKIINDNEVVVIPWDFSDLSKQALKKAAEMCSDISNLRVVHVTQMPEPMDYGVVWDSVTEDSISQYTTESFRKEVEKDERLKDIRFDVLFGDPGTRICDFAEESGANLIVMPSHGRSGVRRFFLGSVAERVVRLAPCPVLVLRSQPTD